MIATSNARNPQSEIFPLLTRFAQEIRSPLTIISVQIVESAAAKQARLIEVVTLSVSTTGATSWSSFFTEANSLSPEAAASAGVRRTVGLREARDAVSFSVLYEHLCRAFLSTIVVGFGSGRFDIPLLLKLMNAVGSPALSPKAHLDVQKVWWQILKAEAGDLTAASAMYNVPVGHHPRGEDAVLAMAKVHEAMLWRHGYEVLAKSIEINEYPYAPTARNERAGASARSEKEKRQRKRETDLRDRLLKYLKTSAAQNPDMLSIRSLARTLATSETKVSMALGKLIAQRRVAYLEFLDLDAQEVLDTYLPAAIAAHGFEKLKPLKEHIEEKSGQAPDYIQLRIALLKRNLTPTSSSN
ncbi:TPA: hypothetical protein L4559_006467 [Pseudomonas aeruginosa]|nr:hypothetical protein [Pseudomonas aeruginosa]